MSVSNRHGRDVDHAVRDPAGTAPHLPLDGRARLLVVTGAGISADSGLATFRGEGGLWAGQRVEDVAEPGAFARDPLLVWRFYSQRRAEAAKASPNAAHVALADVERRLEDRFLLVTQNVDGLHARAGSTRIVEIHGSLWRTRCSFCEAPPFADDAQVTGQPLPECPACRARGHRGLLRPDIVWFGEMLDPDLQARVARFIDGAVRSGDPLVFLAIGTSGTVWPVAGYVHTAGDAGADTWLANLEPAENDDAFRHVAYGHAANIVPELLRHG
jgi:NAD-dependent deacetylase